MDCVSEIILCRKNRSLYLLTAAQKSRDYIECMRDYVISNTENFVSILSPIRS